MVDTRLPIVFVHGFWDKSSVFKSMSRHMKDKGWKVYDSFDIIPNNGMISMEEMAEQLEGYVNAQLGPEASFLLLGFSMGGLVSRYYLQNMGGINRVKHLITISSPHYGTLMAYTFNRKACIQMRPNSIFLNSLNSELPILKKITLTSIWAKCDTTIVPNNSSHLPIGDEVIFGFGIHPLMPYSSKVIKAVEQAFKNN
jgi:triacylglycerol lipase